jgi:hypothetical protein
MVQAVRRGASRRTVARAQHVSLCTVQRWVQRATGQPLNRIDWEDRSHATRHPGRTAEALEVLVMSLRQELRATSALGDYGADAIHRTLLDRGARDVPVVRTIHRILERRGALDGTRRIRRVPPPPGWYLPEVATGRAELDSFDFVEGLVIQGGPHVEVLTGVSLHGGLIGSWPGPIFTAAATMATILTHWRAVGLPDYAQFDNDTRFQGPHQHRDVVSRVMRLCLNLGVTPVFAPPREHGFQNAIENLNGRWQQKVWGRFHHESLTALQACSDRFVAATRLRRAARVEAAPARPCVPATGHLDLQARPTGRVVFLRRTNETGAVALLGHTFSLDTLWPHRLVRCEVQLDRGPIRFYRLRRRQPDDQPLIREVSYALPVRRFKE